MIIFLLMNLIVIISSFLVTYRLFQISNFVDSLICSFIIYFAQIVLSELLLGILGILYLNNVILVNLVILLIIWLMAENRRPSFNLNKTRDVFYTLLRDKIILFGIVVILGFGLVKLGINLINPPFGWDSLNYHFTFPVEWLKHGNLDIPITISDDPSPSYYPINGSLFFLWLIFPFKNVFLADLGQVPFFILAFLATYSISRKLGIKRELSFYAAILFLITPNVFKQLKIAYVDVMVAVLFLICICYLFLLTRKFSLTNVLVYSTSLGLFLGTKTVALPYSVVLVIPFIYLCFKNANKPRLFIISISIVLILGGFTYIRNFLDTTNPLYPLDFKLFSKTIFKGVIDKNNYGAHFKIEDYRLTKLLFHEGLGLQSLIFILPSIFLALPLSIIKKRRALSFNLVYFLILPILICLVYRYIIPLANTRYLYPLLGVGIIVGLYTVQILNIPRRIVNILVVVCILTSIVEIAKHGELFGSIILTLLSLSLIKYIQKKRLIKKSTIVLFLIFIICDLMLIEKDYLKNEYPRYAKMVKYSGFWPDATKAWDCLNRNTTNNNIAYVGRPVPFPLYGTSFKNNVYYVSVNKTDPAKLHYFPNSRYRWGYDFLSLHKNLEEKGNYRFSANYLVWLNNLMKRKTDYLFVYSLHQTEEIVFPLEDRWAKNNPDKFKLVFTNETIHIYRVLK